MGINARRKENACFFMKDKHQTSDQTVMNDRTIPAWYPTHEIRDGQYRVPAPTQRSQMDSKPTQSKNLQIDKRISAVKTVKSGTHPV